MFVRFCMENSVFLEKLLKAYERYYSIKKENVQKPFDVEAEFVMHGEQYILRSMPLSLASTNEMEILINALQQIPTVVSATNELEI